MRVLLVDDEPSARRRLSRLLEVHPDVEIVGYAQDGLEALAHIESTKPDLVFLDVRMPELDGFGVILAMPPTLKMPLVIFATSYAAVQHGVAPIRSSTGTQPLKGEEMPCSQRIPGC